MTDPGASPSAMGAFPAGFAWGAATSAYQIEGATEEAGRGRSIWDTFAHTPGRILDGTTGDVAIDSYHLIDEDIAVMKRLGLPAYRFSVSWPRINPDGDSKTNQAGLDHYRQLVDSLLEADIDPWITLYHWDLPQSLEDAGGWPNRETAYRFADFAATVHDGLADRVTNWITVNEPWCAAFLGYASGEHAPGRRDPAASVSAAHHLLLGHGLAAQAMRARQPTAKLGIGLNFYPIHAATDSAADADAVRRIDGMQNRFFTDAALHGRYPQDLLEDLAEVADLSMIRPGDMETISTPIDTLCVNYYSRFTVTTEGQGGSSAAAAPTNAGSPWPGNEHIKFVSSGLPVTDMNWEVDPDGLRDTLIRLSREHPGVDLVVTENGSAYEDTVEGGEIHDVQRTRYLEAHIWACAQAIEAKVPLRGYFTWSLMDNFEWAWGYTKRFGIVHVDYQTQQRTLKDSGKWYAAFVARNTCQRQPE